MMYQQIHDMGSKYHSFKTGIWLQHDLFSLGWWSIVLDGVIPLNKLIPFKKAQIDGVIPPIGLKILKMRGFGCITGEPPLIYPQTGSILYLSGKSPLI